MSKRVKIDDDKTGLFGTHVSWLISAGPCNEGNAKSEFEEDIHVDIIGILFGQ